MLVPGAVIDEVPVDADDVVARNANGARPYGPRGVEGGGSTVVQEAAIVSELVDILPDDVLARDGEGLCGRPLRRIKGFPVAIGGVIQKAVDRAVALHIGTHDVVARNA